MALAEAEARPVSRVAFDESQDIAAGVDAILRATAIRVADVTLRIDTPEGAGFLNARLDELAPAVQHHWRTIASAIVGRRGHTHRDELLMRASSPLLTKFALLGDLAAHEVEVRRVWGELPNASLVIVAGNQASGKNSLAPVFEESGYTSITMSSLVRDAATAWRLDRNGTMDKIVVGRVLKDYFGDGILVSLGVVGGLLEGKKQLVLFGPRLAGEVDEAIALGGTLVGIAAHADPEIDREIRRARVANRAMNDPSRADDVAKFDEREAIEGSKIAQILAHPQCHLFVDNSPLDEFRGRFEGFVIPLLTKSG